MPATLLPEEEQFLEDLGELVRRARLVANLRQQDLAARVGVSLGVIKRIEKGDGSVALKAWVAVLGALGLLQEVASALKTINPDPFGDATGRQRVKKKRLSG